MSRPTPGPKLEPKVILEGTRLTHKTDLAFALNEHPRVVGPRKYAYHSPLISAEWCGFSPTPWGRGPINFAPEEEERALEVFATWARLFELLPHYSWIIDRFHLSAQAFQRIENGREIDFGWLEDRLLPLGFHLVLCVRRPETFAAAREARLPVSGKPEHTTISAGSSRSRNCCGRSRLVRGCRCWSWTPRTTTCPAPRSGSPTGSSRRAASGRRWPRAGPTPDPFDPRRGSARHVRNGRRARTLVMRPGRRLS